MKTGDVIKLALIGGGIYVVYRVYQGIASGVSSAVGTVGAATTAAGDTIGGALYNFFNPNPAGNMVDYMATLPNGRNTAVPANTVEANGQTTINGVTYQMLVNPAITSGVNKTLVPVSLADQTSLF